MSRNNSFTSVEDDSAPATARPLSQSSTSLDQLNRERKNSLAARRALSHKHVPEQLEDQQQDSLHIRSRHRSDASMRTMASAKSEIEEMPPPTMPIRRSCDDPDQQRIRNRMSLDSSTLSRMNYGRKSFESEASDSNESTASRSPELSIRPQIYLRPSHRGPHRSFHTSDDFGSSHGLDEFGSASVMHRTSSSISSRQLGSSSNSSDMRRSGSDNNSSKRVSIDSWTSLFTTGKAPASDESFSPRSSSPSSNNHALTLERTASLSSAQEGESWWERSRRRLSSVTVSDLR